MRGATIACENMNMLSWISTHTPLARRDQDHLHLGSLLSISTHTPLARRDIRSRHGARRYIDFYSHASCEARREAVRVAGSDRGFLLTRLLRGATDDGYKRSNHLGISTHTPLARRDLSSCFRSAALETFLLTRLLRGATPAPVHQLSLVSNFYSHASCEARRIIPTNIRHCRISTHTPLARRDDSFVNWMHDYGISTHTPLARRDDNAYRHGRPFHNFYSHASCEARQCIARKNFFVIKFLLTRLLRGATRRVRLCNITNLFLLTRLLRGATTTTKPYFQIFSFLLTRPMRGATDAVTTQHLKEADFYSHAPCGARHTLLLPFLLFHQISTHTPHAGRDDWHPVPVKKNKISTHTPHAGRDNDDKATLPYFLISTHTPHAGRDLTV